MTKIWSGILFCVTFEQVGTAITYNQGLIIIVIKQLVTN